MRNTIKLMVLAMVAGLTSLPVSADPVAIASNGKGQFGMAYGFGTNKAAEAKAMGWCGGTANGCKVVMSAKGDCMAIVESRTSAGYWYYYGYTKVQDVYSRTWEIERVKNMVMGFCTSAKGPPAGSCALREVFCPSYIRNLN